MKYFGILDLALEILSRDVDILPHNPEMQQDYLDAQIISKDSVRCPKLPVVDSGGASTFAILIL